MFPRPPRLFRLVTLCLLAAFVIISLYSLTTDKRDSNTLSIYKVKGRLPNTELANQSEPSIIEHYNKMHPVSAMDVQLYSPGERNGSPFYEIVRRKLENNRVVSMNQNTRQHVNKNIAIRGVDFENYDYIHNPSSVCDNHRNLTFLVYIHSSPDNLKKRQAIRQTWGHPKLLSLYNATLIFVLGRVLTPAIQSLIDMEASEYGDILQQDFMDSYRNLTYKGLAVLRWAGTFCLKTEFLLKTDDDILLDIVSLMEYLYTKLFPSRGNHAKLVLCNVWTRMKVIRDPKSKWYVSKDEFPDDFFPVYCSGSAFLLSSDLITALYETALQTPFFWVDDYYITGMLVNKLNVQHTRLNSAYLLNYNVAEEKLQNDTKELMIFHVKKLSLFLKLWPLLMQRHSGMEKYLEPEEILLLKNHKPIFTSLIENEKDIFTKSDNLVSTSFDIALFHNETRT